MGFLHHWGRVMEPARLGQATVLGCSDCCFHRDQPCQLKTASVRCLEILPCLHQTAGAVQISSGQRGRGWWRRGRLGRRRKTCSPRRRPAAVRPRFRRDVGGLRPGRRQTDWWWTNRRPRGDLPRGARLGGRVYFLLLLHGDIGSSHIPECLLDEACLPDS